MAKKLFLNTERERVIPNARAPSVSREEPKSEVSSSSRDSLMSEISQQLPLLHLDETSSTFPKFNATGRTLLIKFRRPAEDVETTVYLKECVTALTNSFVDDSACATESRYIWTTLGYLFVTVVRRRKGTLICVGCY